MHATPDAAWPYSALFKGDAVVWLDYARALQRDEPFELGLPLRPPGTAYLVAALWDGTAAGIARLRLVWAVLGAATVALLFLALERSFGRFVAVAAALSAATSTGLLLLSSSLNNETPYLLLAVGSFVLVDTAATRPQLKTVIGWAALQALACLFRVEHVAFVVLAAAWLLLAWRRADVTAARQASLAGVMLGAFVLPLVPWHLHAWKAVARFNREPPALPEASEAALRQVEQGLAGMPWDDAARSRRDALPAFVRRNAAAFVAATVRHRGGDRVRTQDFGILAEAFGSEPRPLAAHPFVALYGPLNFVLANHAGATGGFSTTLLEEPPPGARQPDRYPPGLLPVQPPPQIALAYPPHLRLVNDGYAEGLGWIRAQPGEFARLAVRKLQVFWSGAALGLTGFNLPLGPSGLRRAVDLVTPDGGPLATVWKVLVFALCAAGIALARRNPALAPWLLFLTSKLLATVAFFGYARQGATCIPVVALLAALALERLVASRLAWSRPRWPAFAVALALLGLAAEAARFASRPTIVIEGRPVTGGDPFPADLHRDQRIDVR